jgi:hypothetical protein
MRLEIDWRIIMTNDLNIDYERDDTAFDPFSSAAPSVVANLSRKLMWLKISLVLTFVMLVLISCGGGGMTPVATETLIATQPPSAALQVTATSPVATEAPALPPAEAPPPLTVAPTAVAPPTKTPVPATDHTSVAELANKELARLRDGVIIFNPPEQMTVGEQERVSLRVAKAEFEKAIAEDMSGSGTPREEKTQISSFMRVELRGPAFEVIPLSSKEQIIPDEGYTEWLWDIVAKEAGSQKLTFVLTAKIKIPGDEDEYKDLKTVTYSVDVHVNPVRELGGFIERHMEALVTFIAGLLVPFSLWIWNKRRKRVDEEDWNYWDDIDGF